MVDLTDELLAVDALLMKADDEARSLLEDWSARVPGKDEDRAALCSTRAVSRVTKKISGIYRKVLRAAADGARREAVEQCNRLAVDRASRFHEDWKSDINDNYVVGKRDGADIVADLIAALLPTLPQPHRFDRGREEIEG